MQVAYLIMNIIRDEKSLSLYIKFKLIYI